MDFNKARLLYLIVFFLAKGYGMTEVSSAATAASGLANKVGSVGIPLVNTLVSVFDPGTHRASHRRAR